MCEARREARVHYSIGSSFRRWTSPQPQLTGKGSTHIFNCYKHVEAEDKEACWAVSPKGWTDNKIGYSTLALSLVNSHYLQPK